MVKVVALTPEEREQVDNLYNRYSSEIHAPKPDPEHPMFRRPERKSLDVVVVNHTEHELNTREDLLYDTEAEGLAKERMRQVQPH